MTLTQTTCRQCGGRLLGGDRFCAHCGAVQDEIVRAPVEEPGTTPWDGVFDHLRATIGNKYEIGRSLGYGGMAAVVLAREIKLNRRVAIKVMSPSLMLAPGMIERFHREAVTVAALNHPNIVTIYTVEETDQVQYFVMKFVAGPSLEAVIRKDGPMPISVVKVWLTQVASALGYAHRRGVVHRDIKPANILLDDEGNAIVTDFGIAKVSREPSLTQVGATVGTPSYMSPEQCQSKEITAASDQYSLGIVLYEMLTGEPPFEGPSLEVMQSHVQSRPRPISVARPDCPQELQAAVFRMIAKNPAERWPAMEDVIAAVGGPPLAHDDPIRLQLAELAGSGKTGQLTPVPGGPPVSKPTPTRVASLQVRPERRVLLVGRSARFQALARGTDGRQLRDAAVRWGSSDRGIVEVATDGMVRGVAPGAARITAVCENQSGTAAVEVRTASTLARAARFWWVAPLAAAGAVALWFVVRPPPTPPPVAVASITVTPATASITVGGTVALAATARAANGQTQPLPQAVGWTSSDSSVATVTPDGIVRGLKAGAAAVRASADGRTSAAIVTVTEPVARAPVADSTVASLDVQPRRINVTVNRTFALRAVGRNAQGSVVRRPVRWVSSDPKVAVVAPNGVVTGVTPGTATISATSDGVNSTPAPVTVVAAGPAPPGVLQMVIVPTWAVVSINGLPKGQRMRGVDTLPSGTYRLHFERAGFAPVDTTVTLQAGEQRLLRIQMIQRNP